MNVNGRLSRLEQRCREAMPQDKCITRPTDEDWYEIFAAMGEKGLFDREPDFPRALAGYRQALEETAARADPPFYPPHEFQPGRPESWRLVEWRRRYSYPELRAAWFWLMEFVLRVRDGIPPVTEAEFDELARWFEANNSRLKQLSFPSEMLDLGNGQKISSTNLRYAISKGPRVTRAGKLAEQLRRLKVRYGDGYS